MPVGGGGLSRSKINMVILVQNLQQLIKRPRIGPFFLVTYKLSKPLFTLLPVYYHSKAKENGCEKNENKITKMGV